MRHGLGAIPRPLAFPILLVGALAAAQSSSSIQRPTWRDLVPIQSYLARHGVSSDTLHDVIDRTHAKNAARVREGDLDHLVFYALQSTRFTTRPPIEPALSAKALVESLHPEAHAAFLTGPSIPDVPVPAAVRSRIAELVTYLGPQRSDERAAFFRQLVHTAFPAARGREAALAREYVRVMRFLYRKEFLAPATARGTSDVHDLYRERGLSTDTAIEAGFVVHTGLAVLQALEPTRRVRRVLVVGPGLDLAPRTGLLDDASPQSYQPWAVMDALVSLGLSQLGDLSIVAADINPRVVDHLRRARGSPPALRLASALGGSDTVVMSPDYLDYFTRLGRTIGSETRGAGLRKVIQVSVDSARALVPAETLDIVTERLGGPGFDLVVATNIFPYFNDLELALAMSNIAAMTRPGGVVLHNEGRAVLGEITTDLGLPFEQARYVTIATIRGATAPLADSVFLHRKVTTR